MAYPVDIRGALEALGSQRVVEGDLALSDVTLGDERLAFSGPASFAVTLTNTGAGIVAAGEVRARATTACVRCLNDFELDVTGEVQGFYVHAEHGEGIPEEQEIEPISDFRVDLEPALVQAIVVELPFAPLHSQDCAGLCAVCGADLNEGACRCSAGEPDSPFAGLEGLLAAEGSPRADEECSPDG